MRYTSKPIEVEAMHWSGPDGDVRVADLQNWGAPVVMDLRPESPVTGGTTMALALATGGRSMAVPIGSWIVKRADGEWRVASDDQFRGAFERLGELDPADDPLPGLSAISATRVGFRRQGTDGNYEWRHAGLTTAEVRRGGWVALYEIDARP